MIIPVTDGELLSYICEVDEKNLNILKEFKNFEDWLRNSERITLSGGGYYYDITSYKDNLKSTDIFDNPDDAKLFGEYIRKDGSLTESFIKSVFDSSVPFFLDSTIFGEWCRLEVLPDDMGVSILPNTEKRDFVGRYGCCVSPYFVKNKTGSYVVKEVPPYIDKKNIYWILGVYDNEVGICIGTTNNDYEYNIYTLFSFCSLTSNKTINMRKATKDEVRHALLGDLEYVVDIIPCS